MKAAAKAWKKKTGSTKKKSQKSSPKKTSKRSGRKTAKKKRKGGGGFRLPGGLGPKGILTGVIGMMVIPRFVPVATPGAAKLATGLALRALKLGGGGALASVGIMELAAQYAAPFIGGFTGGAAAGGNSGVCDY